MTLFGYLKLFIFFIILIPILYLPVFLVLKKKGNGIIRQSSHLFFLWSLFIIVFFTIILFNLPFDMHPRRHVLNLWPLKWLWERNVTRRLFREISPNIVLFIPLGFFLPTAFKHMRKIQMTALVSFTVTFCVEFFQYFIGRASDVDDLIANLSGSLIGYGLYKLSDYLFKNERWWQKITGASNSSYSKN